MKLTVRVENEDWLFLMIVCLFVLMHENFNVFTVVIITTDLVHTRFKVGLSVLIKYNIQFDMITFLAVSYWDYSRCY